VLRRDDVRDAKMMQIQFTPSQKLETKIQPGNMLETQCGARLITASTAIIVKITA